MNLRRLWFAMLPSLVLLAACETTGNPREGGLFGWSESKARQRQAEKRGEVASVESALAREQGRTGHLQSQNTVATRKVAAANARVANERAQEAARIRAREATVRAKVTRLEEESPTAATASRARQLRSGVDSVISNPALSADDRRRQLRELEAEIDEARAALKR